MIKAFFDPTSTQYPWWVKAVFYFGFSTVLAGYLVWFVTGTQANELKEVKAVVIANGQLITTAVKDMRATTQVRDLANARTNEQLDILIELAYQQCLKLSKNIDDAKTCRVPR